MTFPAPFGSLLSAVQEFFMDISYTDKRDFTLTEINELFSTVDWAVSRRTKQLLPALNGDFSNVISARDGGRLVGLICSIDDGVLTAYIHYLLVRPDYRGRGIGTELLHKMTEIYKSYFRIEVIADNAAAGFYLAHGFGEINARPLAFLPKG